MGQVNNGISKIEIGPIAVDGGMGTSLKQLGYTTEDSFKWNSTDPEKKEYFVEEIDSAFYTATKAGKVGFIFEIANPDIDTLVDLFGGTKTGTGTTATWAAPAVTPTIERSVKITPKIGIGFNLPRVLITAKWTDSMGRNALLGITVSRDVLAPTKTGMAPYEVFNVSA